MEIDIYFNVKNEMLHAFCFKDLSSNPTYYHIYQATISNNFDQKEEILNVS